MTKLALVTGATGFLGRYVAAQLGRSGLRLRLVVRGSPHRPDVPKGAETIVTTDNLFLESEDWWTDVCRDVDVIFHTAWIATPGKYLHSEENFDCMTGTLELAKGAIRSGVHRFISIGTCLEYAAASHPVESSACLRPDTPYACTKAATFLALSSVTARTSMEFVWCRVFNIYGEGEHPQRLRPYLHTKLKNGEIASLSGADKVRDFLEVDQAAAQIVSIGLGADCGEFNICSGEGMTVRQFAERIADGYGRRDLLHFETSCRAQSERQYIVGIPSKSTRS